MTAPASKVLTPAERAERNRRKARDWRAKQRAKGLRPVQLWIRDTRDPAFREECRRQALALASSPSAAEDQAWVDAVSIDWSELP
jgi:hypothetical protein